MKRLLIGTPVTKILNNDKLSYVKSIVTILFETFKNKYDIKCALFEEDYGVSIPNANYIVRRDIEWLESIDYAIFILPSNGDKTPVETSGTYVELGYALSKKIPILIILEMKILSNFSPFIQGLEYIESVKIEDINTDNINEIVEDFLKKSSNNEINKVELNDDAIETVKNRVLHDYTTQKDFYPFFLKKAKGTWIEDFKGKKYLDFKSSAFNVNMGYQHPKIIESVKKQANVLASTDLAHEQEYLLLEKLFKLFSADYDRVFFTSGGALAIETALKISRQVTSKQKVVSFKKSYHGTTLGAMNLTGWADISNPFGPPLPGFIKVEPPFCYRCPFEKKYPDCKLFCAKKVIETIEEERPETVSSIFFEPISWGEAIVPPGDFFELISNYCEENNIITVADEIVTGFGRTGKMFGYQNWDFTPDILVLGKGITSGYFPLALIAVKKHISNFYWDKRFTHGYTYQAHPLGCAIANATLDAIIHEDIISNVNIMGNYLHERLISLKKKHWNIGDIRGKGLLWGLELIEDKENRTPISKEKGSRLLAKCKENGLIIGSAIHKYLSIIPPLTLEKNEIDIAISILDKVFTNEF